MVDFHAHILPAMDDGSSDAEESISMLEESARQKIDVIAATPHFFADKETPDAFLKRRQQAFNKIKDRKAGLPNVILGAEVKYFEGMFESKQLDKLCITGTNLLLVEMPFARWQERIIKELCILKKKRGLIAIVAHIERYFKFQKNTENLQMLFDSDVLIQSNAEFFINHKSEKLAMQMLKDRKIHLIGSDCHNCTTRPQNLGEAEEKIKIKLGKDALSGVRSLEFELLKDFYGGKDIL